ncbi:HAD-IC family P-type ATPase [Loigolactobacillus zhaoyuanensis]|uniref:HAD-IC family P-type ATPase n=1 Tax=Loigolactobacillus zhaoyuanensis TaxID=2486017 RepID=A0ABW8UII8_9LACO
MLIRPKSDYLEADYAGQGLNEQDAQRYQAQHGYNEIPETSEQPLIGVLKGMWGPTPWLLEAAMIFELLLGKGTQAFFVLALLLFSAVDGEIQTQRAKKAVGTLQRQLTVTVRLLRERQWQFQAARVLVPGDIVHVRTGDLIPADLVIISGTVEIDEASLTGESKAILKGKDSTLYSAATVVHGAALGQVTQTGVNSTYGKTAELSRTETAPGRLQQLLFNIVRYLAYLDVVLAIMLVIAAVFRGTAWQELLPFLVILFIATIPISMPSSFTVANSLEAKKLTQEKVLVTGLTGVQEAASMDILLIDKTGTITNDQPKVGQIKALQHFSRQQILQFALTATDVTAADSVSTALTNAAVAEKITPLKRSDFTAFDPATKTAQASYTENGQAGKVILGSPDIVATIASVPIHFQQELTNLAQQGARVLALALQINEQPAIIGLIELVDQPRPDAVTAIKAIQSRGVRVMMLTGDTPITAQAIAAQVGIGSRIGTLADAKIAPLTFDGFADVYPQDKLAIVKKLQTLGLVVGMTGDGVNDAPALQRADVGIAVANATDIAKSAAKVVLTRATLADIVKVIDSGHRVYRRMMTWTITKLSRTAQLAALLTFGFIFAGFFPVSLNLIVFIVIMNDCVTLTLGTDHAWPTRVPEHWNLARLAKIAGIFAVVWVVIGLVMFWYYLAVARLGIGEISTLMFIYLIYSAMTTIIMTRTRDHFWEYAPSKSVGWVVLLDISLATIMAVTGFVTTQVSWIWVLAVIIIVVMATLILDRIKMWYYQKTGILGTEQKI